MNDLEHVLELVLELRRDHEAHVVATKAMLRVGPVVERDKAKGVRLQTDDGNGEDGKPHLEEWGQPSERSGRERYVPRAGEHCAQIAPYGNPELSLVLPFGHNKAHPNPSPDDVDAITLFKHPNGKINLTIDKDGKTLTFQNDKVTTVWEGAKITHTVDGNTTVFEKDTITFPDGSKVRHGDRNIGKDHKHGGVMAGSGDTGDPEA